MLLGIFEMLGVASIMPFVALLSDPNALAGSRMGQLFVAATGISLVSVPVHSIGVVVLLLFVGGTVLSLVSMWLSVRFAAQLNIRLSSNLVEGFFSRGYSFLRTETPTVLANYTIREVERAVTGGMLQLCFIVSKLVQVVLVVLLLAFVSLHFSLAFAAAATVMYFVSFRVLRRKMTESGAEILGASSTAMHATVELYASAREVLMRDGILQFVSGIQYWLDKYHKADEVSRVYPMVPKYLIELLAFGMLLALPIYRSWAGLDYASLVPLIALFAYAGYRLLPNLQQIYSSLSILRFNIPAIQMIGGVLLGSNEIYPGNKLRGFNKTLEFRGVGFQYPGSGKLALNNISFNIERGEKLAIIGLSGSGKSTFLDVLLGLVSPTQGEIIVDSHLQPMGLKWESRVIGYAPQQPMILVNTLAANIAFGVSNEKIDLIRCQMLMDFSQASEMLSKLPDGLQTCIGSDGMALSGGESQRLAIARSLYHDPDFLILDEPTSALDPVLSERLLDQLLSPDFKKTVVVVTHDWEALPVFNKIVVLDKGRLIGVGSYDELEPVIAQLQMREARG